MWMLANLRKHLLSLVQNIHSFIDIMSTSTTGVFLDNRNSINVTSIALLANLRRSLWSHEYCRLKLLRKGCTQGSGNTGKLVTNPRTWRKSYCAWCATASKVHDGLKLVAKAAVDFASKIRRNFISRVMEKRARWHMASDKSKTTFDK